MGSIRQAVRLAEVGSAEACVRLEVIATAREMSRLGLVAGTVGNVSARIGDALLITPTRARYEQLQASDLSLVGLDGAVREAGRGPSRELALHLAIYRQRADVAAIVHTHSLCATAWSFVDRPLEPRLEDLDYHEIGEVRTSKPASAGSRELAENAVCALGGSRAALLGGHGVVAVGADLWQALTAAELVERQATVSCLLQGALVPTHRTLTDAQASMGFT